MHHTTAFPTTEYNTLEARQETIDMTAELKNENSTETVIDIDDNDWDHEWFRPAVIPCKIPTSYHAWILKNYERATGKTHSAIVGSALTVVRGVLHSTLVTYAEYHNSELKYEYQPEFLAAFNNDGTMRDEYKKSPVKLARLLQQHLPEYDYKCGIHAMYEN